MPINYHPMNLLPSLASYPSNIADLFTRPLPTISHHRYTHLVIGDATTINPSTSVASTVNSVPVAPTVVDSALTVVASASVPTPVSDSVPTLHPNSALAPTLPIVLDTGASYSRAPSASDFLPVAHAAYGLFRSPLSVVSNSDSKAYSKVVSTPVDPYTLITGEDTATVDLSFPDSDLVDTVELASTLVYSSFRPFGTATLVFLSDANSKLITILVEPTQVDWLHWIPLPRLTPTESYFHISGLDYFQAFTLLHLIPIWIYCLLHFAVNLD